jgi:hypothetical protein
VLSKIAIEHEKTASLDFQADPRHVHAFYGVVDVVSEELTEA